MSAALGGLELLEIEGATRVRLRVRARAKHDALIGVHGGALRIAVTAPPERGKANRAILSLLAEALELRPSGLELASGHASPDKTVRVPLPPDEIRSRLAAFFRNPGR